MLEDVIVICDFSNNDLLIWVDLTNFKSYDRCFSIKF